MAFKCLTLLVCMACVFIKQQMASEDVARRRQHRSLLLLDSKTTKDPMKYTSGNATTCTDVKYLRKGIDTLLSWRGTITNYFHHLKTQLHVVVSRVEKVLEKTAKTENEILTRDFILEAMSGQLLQTNSRLNKLEEKLKDVSYDIQELRDQMPSEQEENLAIMEHSTIVYPKDCRGVVALGHTESGVYTIQPSNYPYSSRRRGMLWQPFYVYCRIDADGGWTVIQRREDNTTDFYRTWHEYKRGFGSPLGEYWLGNDKIHLLTNQGRYKLRISMEDWEGESRYADYDRFVVDDEASQYRLRLGEYAGTAGDSLFYHRGQPFSTWDRDNDARSGNCAKICKGAWWYRSCHQSNLNGLYLYSEQNHLDQGMDWNSWTGHNHTLKFVEMRLLPTDVLSNSEKIFIP